MKKSESNTESKEETVDMNTDFTKKHSGTVSHYEVPNLTSMLYEYTNKEQEYIQRCFRAGNYNYLRDMPLTDKVDEKSTEFQVHFRSKTTTEESPEKKKYSKLIGGGLFK